MQQPIICIGAILIDELFFCFEPVIAATSNPALMKRSAGGVMANIARHLALLQVPVGFITVIGNDADGQWLQTGLENDGIDMSETLRADCATGKYAALLNADGSLFAAACVNPGEALLTPAFLQTKEAVLKSAAMIIADTNLSVESISWLNDFCKKEKIKLLIEPVSVAKARKLAASHTDGIFMVTPNEDELPSLSKTESTGSIGIINELLNRGIQQVWLRRGINGSLICNRQRQYSLAAPAVTVKDITGAGDAALAGWAVAHYWNLSEDDCLKAGHALAAAVIQQEGAIAAGINAQALKNAISRQGDCKEETRNI